MQRTLHISPLPPQEDKIIRIIITTMIIAEKQAADVNSKTMMMMRIALIGISNRPIIIGEVLQIIVVTTEEEIMMKMMKDITNRMTGKSEVRDDLKLETIIRVKIPIVIVIVASHLHREIEIDQGTSIVAMKITLNGRETHGIIMYKK